MCGQWRLDQQDLDTYRKDGLLKPPFRKPDEQLGQMRESLAKAARRLRDPLYARDFCFRARNRRRARPVRRQIQHEPAADLAAPRQGSERPQRLYGWTRPRLCASAANLRRRGCRTGIETKSLNRGGREGKPRQTMHKCETLAPEVTLLPVQVFISLTYFRSCLSSASSAVNPVFAVMLSA